MFIDELLDNAGRTKTADGGSKSNKFKAAFACTVIGAVAGLAIGYSGKFNLFYSALTGAFIGGTAGTLFVPDTKN